MPILEINVLTNKDKFITTIFYLFNIFFFVFSKSGEKKTNNKKIMMKPFIFKFEERIPSEKYKIKKLNPFFIFYFFKEKKNTKAKWNTWKATNFKVGMKKKI